MQNGVYGVASFDLLLINSPLDFIQIIIYCCACYVIIGRFISINQQRLYRIIVIRSVFLPVLFPALSQRIRSEIKRENYFQLFITKQVERKILDTYLKKEGKYD